MIIQHPSAPVNFEPAPPDPPHVRALKGEVAPDTCAACGHPLLDHVGGCALAIRQNKPMQTAWPMGVLYGDPFVEVTRAITYALATDCGPAMAIFFDTFGPDEALSMARALATAAVTAMQVKK
jgi:hypothetical protein